MGDWGLQSVTVADAADLARNNISAFWQDRIWRVIWPSHVTQDFLIAQMAKRQSNSLLRNRAATRHQKAVDPATGALVGYARWVLPNSHLQAKNGNEPTWPGALVPTVSEEEQRYLEQLAGSSWWQFRPEVEHMDNRAIAVKNRIMSTKPYLMLDYLAVHPDNQGKGIASLLVASGIREAKAMGLPIFILAFEAGIGVYKRLGFREVDRVTEDMANHGGEGEYVVYMMVYDVNTMGDNPQLVVSKGSSRDVVLSRIWPSAADIWRRYWETTETTDTEESL
ncbi:gcn5-related n-acetyltransferase [Grosmannia clavigera kw1407]|uniref:Gcn5-related n-acetyltransferase n=1 Tax=Grosmannia clavigera (strain kw1407 / UAMH 11150) TaxID=655863 RepID=F0X9Q2_GROCL|nr:gcn5-related n-acetyltransferase [Grosmannia clavigera kw1407]EFX05986.1 gcn5-related n-acetyltransferase [Grosmannia clavigera kw1407]